jgi:hypothetical protein
LRKAPAKPTPAARKVRHTPTSESSGFARTSLHFDGTDLFARVEARRFSPSR